MMKPVLFLLSVIAGCAVIFFVVNTNVKRARSPAGLRIRVIDGCEYIASPTYMGYETLTHKGNCTNEVHRRQ